MSQTTATRPETGPSSVPGGRPRPLADLLAGRTGERVWASRLTDAAGFERRALRLPSGPTRSVLLAVAARIDGRPDECLERCREADPGLTLPTVWRARLLETQGAVLGELRLVVDALRSLEEARGIYATLGDRAGVASADLRLAGLDAAGPRGAVAGYRRILDDIADLDDADELRGLVLMQIQLVGAGAGLSLDERSACAAEAVRVLTGCWPRMATFARCALVELALDAGDVALAVERAHELPRPGIVTDRAVRVDIACVLARTACADGRPEDGVAVLEEALGTDLEPDEVARVYDELCTALARAGRMADAHSMSCRAFAALQEVTRDHSAAAARALDVWHRTSLLRQDRVHAQARADALEVAVDGLRRATERIRELSIRDTVTGLHNRQHLLDSAPRILATVTATRQAEVALVDLDHFKQVNDRFGHAAGDEVLRHVAVTLLARLRPTDLVARYGGEEIVVVRPPVSGDETTLCEDLHALRAALRELPPGSSAAGAHVAVSGGVTLVGDAGLDAALRRADELMYRAKSSGRDRILCDATACERRAGDPGEPEGCCS